jgi:hypothetical protein
MDTTTHIHTTHIITFLPPWDQQGQVIRVRGVEALLRWHFCTLPHPLLVLLVPQWPFSPLLHLQGAVELMLEVVDQTIHIHTIIIA